MIFNKIGAIKQLREFANQNFGKDPGLKAAKDYVELAAEEAEKQEVEKLTETIKALFPPKPYGESFANWEVSAVRRVVHSAFLNATGNQIVVDQALSASNGE